jgi:hypothetical protein
VWHLWVPRKAEREKIAPLLLLILIDEDDQGRRGEYE